MLIIVWLAAGCRSQAPVPTQVTVAQATTAVATQVVTARPAAAVTPSGQAAAPCIDDAVFLSDLTIPDGTLVQPGQVLDKRWSVRNSGTCDWGPGYQLVPILPNPLASDGPLALYPARAGADAVWQVTVQVPSQPGDIIGRWQAQAPGGTTFGQEVFINIRVANVTATPAPASTSSPQP